MKIELMERENAIVEELAAIGCRPTAEIACFVRYCTSGISECEAWKRRCLALGDAYDVEMFLRGL